VKVGVTEIGLNGT